MAESKLETGMPLVILGIETYTSREGMQTIPESKKCQKWCALIKEALEKRHLSPGEASKMAGRLCWANQV